MNVESTTSFLKDFDKLSVQEQDRIEEALEKLENMETLSESSNLLKIKGSENEFRLRVGSYRVLLQWDKKQQLILAVGVAHRKDIYRKK
jgi:mRNA interferase RelE/StbE